MQINKILAVGVGSAILVTFGGVSGATAARLVTSAQIKDNTIQSRDVANGSLDAADINAKTKIRV